MMYRIIKITFFGLGIIAILLLTAQFVLSNELASWGGKIKTLDQQISETLDHNELLTEQIASASALFTVQVKAKEQGFVEPARKQYVTLTVDNLPVALNIR